MDTAIFTGILTSFPIIYIAFFASVVFVAVFHLKPGAGQKLPAIFPLLALGNLLNLVLVTGLLIYYISYVFKRDLVPKDKKVLWAVVLFLGTPIAMPVFWYHYVWTPAREASR